LLEAWKDEERVGEEGNHYYLKGKIKNGHLPKREKAQKLGNQSALQSGRKGKKSGTWAFSGEKGVATRERLGE